MLLCSYENKFVLAAGAPRTERYHPGLTRWAQGPLSVEFGAGKKGNPEPFQMVSPVIPANTSQAHCPPGEPNYPEVPTSPALS